VAFDFIQGISADVASTTTTTLTFPGAVTPGSLLHVSVRAGASASDTMTVCSDSVNGSYTPAHSPVLNATHCRVYDLHFPNTAAGTPIVTITFSSATSLRWSISELGEIATTSPLDQVASGIDTTAGTTVTTDTINTTVADIILLSHFAGSGAFGSDPGTNDTGWTRRFSVPNGGGADGLKHAVSTRVVASAAAYNDILTFSGGVSDEAGWAIMAYKKVAAAGANANLLAGKFGMKLAGKL